MADTAALVCDQAIMNPAGTYYSTPRKPDQDLFPQNTESQRLAQQAPLLFGSGKGNSPAITSPTHVPFTGGPDRSSFSRQPASQARGGLLSPSNAFGAIPQPMFSPPGAGQPLGGGGGGPPTTMGGLRAGQPLQQAPPSLTQPQPPRLVPLVGQRDAGPPLESMLDLPGIGAPSATAGTAALPPATPLPASATPAAFSGREGGGFWVTAFGFHGSAMLPVVLQELRPSGGDLMQHRMGSGSWIHVQLRSHTDQLEALAKNGRVVHGFMLGVLEGIVPKASSLDAEGIIPKATSLDFNHPLPQRTVPLRLQNSRGAEFSIRPKMPSSIARRESSVLSFLNKACEFIFGW